MSKNRCSLSALRRHSLHAQGLVGVQYGIAYMPGSKDWSRAWHPAMAPIAVDGHRRLEQSAPACLRFTSARSVCRWDNQARPEPVPTSLHGAISAHEHPNAANKLSRGATADDIIGNRIYASMGRRRRRRDDDSGPEEAAPCGVRGHLGSSDPNSPDAPTEAELIDPNSPTVGSFLYVARSRRPHVDAGVRVETAELPGLHRVPDARHRALGVRSDGQSV